MSAGSARRRAERAALKGIPVKVRYAPEKIAPKDDMPQGTTNELLAWVGSSEIRAKRVLAREIEERSPRPRLITELSKMLDIPARQ